MTDGTRRPEEPEVRLWWERGTNWAPAVSVSHGDALSIRDLYERAADALRRLRGILVAATALAVLLVPESAWACETVETARLDSDCVVMPFGEARGVWFRLEKADELRRATLELNESRAQIERLYAVADIRNEQIEAYRAAAEERKAALVVVQEANARLVSDARRAREEKQAAKAWYRAPWLWFTVGIVTATAANVAIFRIASK